MSKIQIETTQNVTIEYEIASLGDRIFAYLIDRIICFGYLIMAIGLIDTVGMDGFNFVWIIVLLPVLTYDLLFEVFYEGQSLGKRARNIRVIALDGRQQPITGYIFRWILRVIDFSVLGPIVAIIAVAATEKNQRLGDLAGGTTVVSLKERKDPYGAKLPEFEKEYEVTFPEVTQLRDQDIDIVEQVIATYGKTESKRALYAMVDKLKETLNLEVEMPPLTFLKTVVKDYRHLTSL